VVSSPEERPARDRSAVDVIVEKGTKGFSVGRKLDSTAGVPPTRRSSCSRRRVPARTCGRRGALLAINENFQKSESDRAMAISESASAGDHARVREDRKGIRRAALGQAGRSARLAMPKVEAGPAALHAASLDARGRTA